MTEKISSLLTEYFQQDRERSSFSFKGEKSCPVVPSQFSWEIHTDPERFSRKFKFESRPRLISFVNYVLSFEDEFHHRGEIRIDDKEVDISVYTHDVNKITELDKEYVRHVDNIYRDVLDFEYK